MSTTHPELAKEFHPTKNGEITPEEVGSGSHKRVWWLCKTCEHEWRTTPGHRTQRNSGCPACSNKALHIRGLNSLAVTHPDIATEFHPEKNEGLTPSDIIAGTSKKLWWLCSTCDHDWVSTGKDRVFGNGCPACDNKVIHRDGRNSMASTHPELAKEFHPEKNEGLTPSDIVAGTGKKLWWLCSTCENEWSASSSPRTKGVGCPACSNKTVHIDGRNSMANTHPNLAIEYQGDAMKIIAGTSKELDWKCPDCEHEWKASGHNRTNAGSGCPACSGRVVHSDGRNSMANTHPKLVIEYQGDATLITAGTDKKLEWKCSDCEYEWKAAGTSRSTHGSGCPACAETGYNPSIIGYVYVHHYHDENNNWLKCGITNYPSDRFNSLKRNAEKSNIEVNQLEIYKFDDGFNAQQCESELLSMKSFRFDSGYDVDGKTEFFKYQALEKIKIIISNWL